MMDWARQHTCWLPSNCQALHVLPESLVSKPGRIRWIALLVKQDVLQSEVVLDGADDNPPVWTVECDIFAFVDELDLVCLRNHNALPESLTDLMHVWLTIMLSRESRIDAGGSRSRASNVLSRSVDCMHGCGLHGSWPTSFPANGFSPAH